MMAVGLMMAAGLMRICSGAIECECDALGGTVAAAMIGAHNAQLRVLEGVQQVGRTAEY